MFVQGLWTQAWGTLFYPLALAYTLRHLEDGDALGRAMTYGLLTGCSHPFLAISLVPAVLVTGPYHARAVRRGLVLAFVVLVASAFFWFPIVTGFDDFGAFPFRLEVEAGMPPGELWRLVRHGTLLDHGRLPVLQTFVFVALGFSFVNPLVRKLLLQAAVLLAAMVLGTMIGDSNDNLFAPIRFTPAMQISLASAAGFGAAELGRRLAANDPKRTAVVVLIGLGSFAYLGRHAVERGQVMRVRVISDYTNVHARELEQMLAVMGDLPHGRVDANGESATGSHWWMYLPWVYADKPALRSYGGASRQGSPTYVFLHEDIDHARHYRVYAIRYVLAKTIVDEPRRHELRVHRSAIDPAALGTALATLNATVSDGPFGYVTVHAKGVTYTEARIRALAVSTSTKTSWHSPRGPVATVRHRTDTYVLSELPITGYADFRDRVTEVPQSRKTRRAEGLAWLAGDGPLDWSDRGRLGRESWAPSRYEAQVTVDGDEPLWMVLAVSHHRGWRASVDGVDVPVTRVMPASMGIHVPPGSHQVVWTYHRPAVFWWLLGLAALTVLGVVYYSHRSSRWHQEPSMSRNRSDPISS